MYTAIKVFKFECSHILDSSYTKPCQQIHGHSYKVEVHFISNELNKNGMVIDFGEIKDLLKEVFDKFDHAFVVSTEEKLQKIGLDKSMKTVIMNCNPTAENMAFYFWDQVKKILIKSGYADERSPSRRYQCVFDIKIRVWETDTGCAEYSN